MTIEPAVRRAQKVEGMRMSSPSETTQEPLRREGETTTAAILRRIGGGAPYFALEDLVFDGAELRAQAATETDPGAEVCAVSAAELTRHAITAGMSAVALGRPDAARCYYLVSSIDATLFRSQAPFGTRAHYSALATEQGPVGGAAQIEVRVERELVGQVRASFAVVPEKLFLRLFVRHQRTTFGDTGSHKSYPPLTGLFSDRTYAKARFSIPRSACRGHFEQHPALPVTGLVGQMLRLGSSLIEAPFRVTALRLRSQALAWAGEELDLHLARSSGAFTFTGHASVEGRVVATLAFSTTAAARAAS